MATGRMLARIFAALAEYERELMHERVAAAREAARARRPHTGAAGEPERGARSVTSARCGRVGSRSGSWWPGSGCPGHSLPGLGPARLAGGPPGDGTSAGAGAVAR